MKPFFAIALLSFCVVSLFAQPGSITVKAGENPDLVLPASYRYLYETYRAGTITMSMHRQTSVKVNYDLLLHLLIFINESNDTLAIQKDDAVKSIQIGKEDFYHDTEKGYFKILATDTVTTLASQVSLQEIRHQMAGNDGYGSTNATGSFSSIKQVNGTAGMRNVDVTYQRMIDYFFIDQQGLITRANKVGFREMFSNLEKPIKVFSKKENIDFDKEEDLIKLFKYCLSFTTPN